MTKQKSVRVRNRVARDPQFADYAGLGEEFRPFVGFVHECGYRSPSVNTDWLGLREHYDSEGNFVDLLDPPSVGEECDVLLGGSVAFGVPASSDRATLAAHLNRPGRTCLNLGLRGATSQQELALFLVLRSRLPPVRNVVLLSGVNECLLAALDRTVVFPEYGGAFTGKARLSQLDSRVLASPAEHRRQRRFAGLAERAYSASRRIGSLAGSGDDRATDMPFDQKLAALLEHVAATLQAWAALQGAWGLRVHYVLQPVFSWGDRAATPRERRLVAAERAEIPASARLEDPELHARLRDAVAAACEREGVAFHDSNEWLAGEGFAAAEVFVDHCHLTDSGTELLAAAMRSELTWS